jgi:hypothetical protein
MRTLLSRIFIVLSLFLGSIATVGATAYTCDQSFSPLYLRYGAYHYLQDKVSNPNNYMLYAQTMKAEFSTL